MSPLKEEFGDIDIYLFDQLLKGRFNACRRIADIGCGTGRNLHYFLRNSYEVFGIDRNEQAIEIVQELSSNLAPDNPVNNFVVGGIEDMPFEAGTFDVAIASAVLHFARNEQHFEEMLHACWRLLRPGGFFFARLASDIGIEHLVQPLGDGRFLLPDRSERYLVNLDQLLDLTAQLDGFLYEPIKTTNVQNLRCMTTWCVRKN